MITKGEGGGRMMDGNWDLALFAFFCCCCV